VDRIKLVVLFGFLAMPFAHAQVTVEISKITCQQYLAFSIADPRDINIWLSGYYHGKRGSTAVEPQLLKQDAEKLKAECLRQDNSNLPVLQVIEKAMAQGK
jgi:acid stress chaperone HdeB